MLTPSVKSKYALSAMLTLAASYNTQPIQIRHIASTQNIPQNYLEQVLVDLKKAGLVKSFRGAQGGYALDKSPEEITVYDIMEILEGPCQLSGNSCDCKTLDQFWKTSEEKIKQVFQTTLADLVVDKQRLENMVTYAI